VYIYSRYIYFVYMLVYILISDLEPLLEIESYVRFIPYISLIETYVRESYVRQPGCALGANLVQIA
jgi:hypothetical protein